MASERYRILAVDDSEVNSGIIQSSFSGEYDVSIACSAEEALVLLDKLHPDLILLDIVMPGMDGFEFCRNIKSREDMKDVPILFLTAKTDSDEILKGFNAGASDYVTKPFNVPELSARVRVHLDLKKSRDQVIRKNRQQNELLHILYHDLANTFTSLTAQSALLDEDCSGASGLPMLKSSIRNGCRIIEMVRTIGDAETILTPSAINLKDSIDQSISILSSQFEKKNITLRMDINPGIHIYAEETSLINSVLNNILTNAVKFSYPGEAIEISLTEEDDHIRLLIRDRGIGMPPHILDGIFHPGSKGSRKGTSGEQGTGYGMPLVKKFLDKYGASIEIRSRTIEKYPEDHGTSVLLRFRKEGV
ncbi:MAG: response regulator [Spirochaetales bacterium]|nr:response regulator [Spirochaetales bacterium]